MKGFRILVAACALVLTACGDGSIQSPDFTSVLKSITVAPASGTVAAGLTQQYVAYGVYTLPPGSNPTTETRPLDNVSWSSENPSVASIDSVSGLATAVSQGSTVISASANGKKGSATLTVGPPALQSLTIDPSTSTIAVDGTETLTARGRFSDGSTQPVTADWTSGNPNVLTVAAGPASTTTATGIAVGSTVITATAVGTSIGATANATVRAKVTSLTIVPDSGTSPAGRPFQYQATGTVKSGPSTTTPANTADGSLTGVVWTVSNALGETNPAAVANIDSERGIATGLRAGNAVVTAAVDGLTDTADFTVTPAVLDNLTIEPTDPSLAVGTVVTLTARGVYTDGIAKPVAVDWTLPSSSVPGIVTFDPANGSSTQITGQAVGTGTIRATAVSDPAITDETGVTVTSAVLQSLVGITPPTARVNPGRSVEFFLQGMYSDGVVRNIDDSQVTWTSGTTAVATIGADGVATGVMEGTSTITATASGVSGSETAQLTVTESACTTPLLTADGATVEGISTGLCIGCSLSDGAAIIDGSDQTFGTLSTTVGLIDATMSAAVTANANPNYTIPFAAGSNAGFVIGQPVGSLVLAELLAQLRVSTLLGGAIQESSGDLIPLRVDLLGIQLLGGQSSDAVLVSIQTSAPYDGVALTLLSGAASALTDVQVFQACGTVVPPVQTNLAKLTRIEPANGAVIAGQTKNFVAYGVLANGDEVEIADADLNWSIDNTAVATVDVNGLLTAVSAGTAKVTATLKANVAASGTPRTITTDVTVVDGACTTRFLSANGAKVASDVTGLCLFCNVANTSNVIDGQLQTAATMTVPVSLLGGSTSITVTLPDAAPVLPAGPSTGFVLGRPAGNILTAELLSSLTVDTLLNGVVQESTGPIIPLRLDLLGISVVDGSQILLASLPTTLPYNGIQLTFNSGIATALSNVLVYDACAVADPTLALAP
ncbi:hypothetical protein E4T66_09380 [Sinimarinibacterium sp. CAU 1509]|uniref:beta strand repeat-containing protein n=1 Tax=Sinimarinibacterium sp. CAU 1509 TaxID=2562283 RepID=UPI0010AC0A08|nr:Ig-like domain-containing protein [Sinimarinibacterium sp. CAU 1509]TJY60859.1 hypothetical protein E4T66_09380 [Sinimarinibacterium sp. CAU 1509]